MDKQRQKLKSGGKMLVVGETKVVPQQLDNLFARYGKPSDITWKTAAEIGDLKDASFDDVVYFGANADTVAKLFPKVGVRGLFNIVQCGSKFGRLVVSQVGRVHYGAIRVIGTTGSDPAEAMSYIPATAEIRARDKINIIGAAGPMGTMHVIRRHLPGRAGCDGVRRGPERRASGVLRKLAESLAEKHKVTLRTYNPSKEKLTEQFDYIVLMAPVPALVVASVASAAKRASSTSSPASPLMLRRARPRYVRREAALLHRHQRLDARRYEAGAGQGAGAPARH